MNRSLASSVILAAGALTCAAGAEVYMGTGGAVADNNVSGSNFTLNVADSLVVSDISVTLTNFRHAHLGHLVATLTHEPTGTSITLFDQVGRTTPCWRSAAIASAAKPSSIKTSSVCWPSVGAACRYCAGVPDISTGCGVRGNVPCSPANSR